MSEVFISHVEEDAAVAETLADGLAAAGYDPWCYEAKQRPRRTVYQPSSDSHQPIGRGSRRAIEGRVRFPASRQEEIIQWCGRPWTRTKGLCLIRAAVGARGFLKPLPTQI